MARKWTEEQKQAQRELLAKKKAPENNLNKEEQLMLTSKKNDKNPIIQLSEVRSIKLDSMKAIITFTYKGDGLSADNWNFENNEDKLAEWELLKKIGA